jgi:hypothetical protein
MIDALSIERFNDLVASYGANLERWPADRRNAAIHCLVSFEAAREAWRDAADLDAALDGLPEPGMSPQLVERVMAIADDSKKQSTGVVSGIMRYAVPYAAAAAIALTVGLAVPSPFRDATGTALQSEIAVTEPAVDEDIDDPLTTLALVDVRTIADDEANSDDDFNDDSPLDTLPLL